MPCRAGCYLLILLIGFVTFSPSESRGALPSASPPNIVLIVSDDQSWTDFGFMQHPAIKTPHLDRLARHSAVFRRGYVPTSLCRPSLATLITGLYPHQHGITGNDPPRGTDRSAMLKHIRAVPTLPRLLAGRGYRCFQSGKWWEGNPALGGFTAGMTNGDPVHGGRHGDDGLRIGRSGLQPVFDFITSCGKSPYFVWYAPMMPHLPHTPPERLLMKYRAPGRPRAVAAYFAMCEWFDETCGELLDFIERKGDMNKTLVVFVVDNGWGVPAPAETEPRTKVSGTKEDHRPHPQFAPRTKLSPYDGGIRTPIFVSWLGKIAPADYPPLVSSIDIAPTILAAAGIPRGPAMSGLNLLDVISAGGHSPRSTVFGAIFEHDVVDIDNPVRGLRYRWCVDDRWKLIDPVDHRQAPELYDVIADPHERSNRAAKQPQTVRKLQAELDAWWPIAR